jgi:hypothetical protein
MIYMCERELFIPRDVTEQSPAILEALYILNNNRKSSDGLTRQEIEEAEKVVNKSNEWRLLIDANILRERDAIKFANLISTYRIDFNVGGGCDGTGRFTSVDIRHTRPDDGLGIPYNERQTSLAKVMIYDHGASSIHILNPEDRPLLIKLLAFILDDRKTDQHFEIKLQSLGGIGIKD